MTTDSRLRTLVSEGRGSTDSSVERKSSPVDTIVTPRSGPSVSAEFEPLQVGELVAGRFQIQLLAQIGGMGSIYRAEDLLDGKLVAIKTLRRTNSLERFEREAARLATLHHPGIPAYVASGVTASGHAYLAMEWLDGVDLATYTRQRRLGVQTAVGLVRAVAEAVATAHALGIVHRDLNPTNLFLVNQRPENVRVLDFGISRVSSDARSVTEQGARIGTPGYMAPEQIEGRAVTPQTDVFALGCVLYELLTGQRAFQAPTVAEILARIVRDDPEPPSSFQGAIPPELDEVVLGCLEKNPSRRPEHAAELVDLLSALQGLVDSQLSGGPSPSSRSAGEPHVSSLIVLKDEPAGTYQRASQAAAPHGLRAQRSSDGTIVLVASGPGTATDHAARAARCALAVQKATRAPELALSTGLAHIDGPSPSGRAFDAAILALSVDHGDDCRTRGSTIWLDENTATLLDSRFEVRHANPGFVLSELHEAYEPSRTVLGRKSRCVSRKRELSVLEATLRGCIEEGVAGAVLITGPPGIGKSRLAYELTRRVRHLPEPVEILRAGADPMSATAPFSLLIQAIHRACDIRDTEAEASRRIKLTQRLARVVPPPELPRVSEFLGELIGTPVAEEESPALNAARRDSMLRGDQILKAFEDWLRAECSKQTVLLILDDFHWADLPTVKFIDSILQRMSELPLLVVALARPEVHDFFPRLWAQRGATELRLSGLSRRAAREMIHDVLGPQGDAACVERVISLAQGNPFWIEELLRAGEEGHGEDVPERVLLLAQSRIEQLNVDARRLLRAASVFGQRFWLAGAQLLLGAETLGRSAEAVIRDLVEGQFLKERELGGSPTDRQFEFSNGLLRDAAYSLLLEGERELAHGQAAQWLERSGNAEPLPIAIHYTLGGEPDRARPHYLRAAEHALRRNDLDEALSSVEAGLAAGASGQDAVALRLVQAEASRWRGDNTAALRWARVALEQAAPGRLFYRALAEAASAAGKTGDVKACLALVNLLRASLGTPESELERSIASSRLATQLVLCGETRLGRQLLDEAKPPATRLHPDPLLLGFQHEGLAVLAGATADPLGRMEFAARAAEYFDDAGDLRNSCLQRISLGFAQLEFGANEDARATLRDALRVAERLDLSNSVPIAKVHLGRALGRSGATEEAFALLQEAAGLFDRHKNLRLAGMSRLYLAELHLGAMNGDLALDAARRALTLLEPFPPLRRAALATLALVLLDQEESAQALVYAREAYGDLEHQGHLAMAEDLVRLAWTECLLRQDDAGAAESQLKHELARLERTAARLPAPRRTQYLDGAPERRRLVALASAHASEPPRPLDSYAQLLARGVSACALPAPSCLETVLTDAARIEAEPDLVLGSLWITQRYHQLSVRLAHLLDNASPKWPDHASRAAKAVGLALAKDEGTELLETELGLDRARHGPLPGPLGPLLSGLGLGRVVHQAARAALLEQTAQLVAWTRAVFLELGPPLARFVDLLESDPTDRQVREFTDELGRDARSPGGENPLGDAFQSWYAASQSDDARKRAQLVLYGNCLIAQYEQLLLESHLQSARRVSLESRFRSAFLARWPKVLTSLLGMLILLGLRSFRRRLGELGRQRTLRYALQLELPRPRETSTPEPNYELPELHALVRKYEAGGKVSDPLAPDCGDSLHERVATRIAWLRIHHERGTALEAPFLPHQEELLAEGRVPELFS